MIKVKIVSFGCSNNFAEGEMMAGLLQLEGYKIVSNNEDLIIINLCSVKGPSLHKGLREARKSNAKTIFAGCIPKHEIKHLLQLKPKASLINTHNIDRIIEAVEKTLDGKQVKFLEDSKKIKLCLPRKRKNKVISIIPISSGCVSSCNYCIVKSIKGDLFSYPPNKILEEIKLSLDEGCKEIWITAQDTGCYGLDINTSLPELLKKVLKIKGDFKVRLGMANPNFVHKYLKELIEIFKDNKMFKFLHMPIQSGSDKILKDMNRKYSIKQYKEIIIKFKKQIHGITISTDLILGYPTETEKDFQDSIELVKETKPDILNINRFWSMPGTLANKLKSLQSEVLKKRSLEMAKLFDKITLENNSKWLNWEGEILIDEKGKNDSFVGRNFAYKPVVIKGNFKIGELIKVKIKEITKFDLRA